MNEHGVFWTEKALTFLSQWLKSQSSDELVLSYTGHLIPPMQNFSTTDRFLHHSLL